MISFDQILSIQLLTGILLMAGFVLLSKSFTNERGLGTLASGSYFYVPGLIAYHWPVLAWPAMLLIILGLLLMLAGARRFTTRPAMLGIWGAWPLMAIAGWVASQHYGALLPWQAMLLIPPLCLLARACAYPDNDETNRWPRWLLQACFALSALAALGLGAAGLAGQNIRQPLTLLLCSAALWPVLFLFRLAHRLHARLGKLSRYDALTGLFNRRGLEELAQRELRKAGKLQQPGNLLLLRLRDFAAINQRYGFAAGDKALSECAGILRSHLAAGMVAGRTGGGEFAVLMTGTEKAPMRLLSVELDMALRALQVEHGDLGFRLQPQLMLVQLESRTLGKLLALAREKLSEQPALKAAA